MPKTYKNKQLHGQYRCGFYRCHSQRCIGSTNYVPFQEVLHETDVYTSLISEDQGFGGNFTKFTYKFKNELFLVKEPEQNSNQDTDFEHMPNLVADILNIDNNKHSLTVKDNIPCFVSKVFLNDGDVLQHFATYLNHSQWNFTNILDTLKKESTNLKKDIPQLIKLITFDLIVGNCDRHNKNLSFIVNKNKKELSPAFDNFSWIEKSILDNDTFMYQEHDIKTSIGNSTIHSFKKEFEINGVIHLYNEFIKNINYQDIEKIIMNSKASKENQKIFLKYIKERIKEL